VGYPSEERKDMKEKVNLGRHFGFHWEAELDPEYGETLISAQEANTRGGWFTIIHTPDEDDFGLYEEGGRGPDIWDEEHGYFDTLLEAMREARRLYKAELEYLEEWERNNLPPEDGAF
jgi:hypothetical protein